MLPSICRRIGSSISHRLAVRDSERFIAYLRARGVSIGEGCTFYSPPTHLVDMTRPELISIGNDVKIAAQSILLTHGFDWAVLRNLHPGELFGSAGSITIGNNVFIGIRSTILKGSLIGDNSVIGAGSVVAGHIPVNSVAAGVPAKVVCSVEELYRRYKSRELDEAKLIAQRIFEVRKRRPTARDFQEYFYLFLTGAEAENWGLNVRRQTTNRHYANFMNTHKPMFKSFDEFLRFCGIP